MRILISAFFLLMLFLPTFSLAEYNKLPDVMVGQTKVITGSGADTKNYYGGMTGNEAIKNYDPNFSELTGFNKSYLVPPTTSKTCYLMQLTQITECFKITPASNILKLMTSRTYFNGNPGLETAVLFYPSAIIIGDVYSQLYNFSGFDFFGRNLYKSEDGDPDYSNATWDEPNYVFNTEAQSSFSGEQQDYYRDQIELLKGEADHNAANASEIVSYNNWYLQNGRFTNSSAGGAEYFPEGKTWYIQPAGGVLRFDPDETYIYHGKGTLIVEGDVEIPNGTRILSDEIAGGSLGIIASGSINFEGNNQVRAAIFSEARVNIRDPANNVEVMGSVVAKNFLIQKPRIGIRFFYDFNLEDNWPPGFRYFQMPHPELGS